MNERNNEANIEFTTDPSKIKQADFVLICVPTPVTQSKEPDLRYVKLFCFAKTFTKTAYAISSRGCGKNLKKGAIVVLESTVYPGVTEEVTSSFLLK
ncbi:MAG: hypothetical protein WA977_08020 [Halobacteriota archaeon]